MTENAIQYDRNKDRQGLFKEEFFRQSYQNNLWLLNVALEGMHEFPTSPPETVVDSLYVLTIAEYTAGYPIEIVRDRFAQAIEYSRLCLAIDEKYPVDDPELIEEGWTMSVWGGGASGRDFLVNAIGLCLLFEQADWLEIVKRCYELDGFIDTSFNALINMVIPMDFDPKAKFRRGGYNFRKPLLQAIIAESKEESLKYLNAYLAGWYDGNRKIGNPLIDTHLEQDPEYGGYIGYWSFESAAVAYLKDLDDTSLRQYLYYPKDMVDWAREQKL
ncbi:TPA: PoNe immunity protein domain-containing protein, partial [Neisseria subflava]